VEIIEAGEVFGTAILVDRNENIIYIYIDKNELLSSY
jgi:hypothetical protein